MALRAFEPAEEQKQIAGLDVVYCEVWRTKLGLADSNLAKRRAPPDVARYGAGPEIGVEVADVSIAAAPECEPRALPAKIAQDLRVRGAARRAYVAEPVRSDFRRNRQREHGPIRQYGARNPTGRGIEPLAAEDNVHGGETGRGRGRQVCQNIAMRHAESLPPAAASRPAPLGELDLYLFAEGRHDSCWRFLGAHCIEQDGVAGTRFAVWAPNASQVHVQGDFNAWSCTAHPLWMNAQSGIWTAFVPGEHAGSHYKFAVQGANRELQLKSDPCGLASEQRPGTASVIRGAERYTWGDAQWMARRASGDWLTAPMSVYEVHLGSWRRRDDGTFKTYVELADELVDYVVALGFTHLEMLPLTEHPLDASWGYQCLGYFCPTARFGGPDELRYLIDRAHQRGVGVILDWVPAHFPRDAHGLARFDGTALYEHADPRQGEHRDWNTLIFNFGRNEVRSFLLSSARYWIDQFHFDGLRVDAVASMLYLDYSREDGDWVPNHFGGNTNIDAVDFLRDMNRVVMGECPGAITIAEESTSWPHVSRPQDMGGLGFAMKWNLGWMHDTLDYLSQDPVYRQFHHDRLTFAPMYAHTENFVLPFSHDEVVHGKRSLLGRMPGDEWQRFANLRLLLTFQWTFPGKKLLFMGGELAQYDEWNEDTSIGWGLRAYDLHASVTQLVGDLNALYREHPALHELDFQPQRGFEWIDCHDHQHSVLSYLRRDRTGSHVVVVLNFTPVPRHGYRIGLPGEGRYRERLNSDAGVYGGSNDGNDGVVDAEPVAWMGRSHSAVLRLPPLGALVLVPDRAPG